MSLHTLLALRKQTHKVPRAIWIVIGKAPSRMRDLPDCIEVSHGNFPADWRCVVGLHVDVFDLSGSEYLLGKTLDALEAAQAKAIGVACHQGVLGLSEEHETAMRQIWRHLGTHS